MYQSMIHTPYFQQSSFPSMKVFLSGGAPCPQTIYHTFHEKGLKFKEGYGLTEAGPNNFYIRSEEACRKLDLLERACYSIPQKSSMKR